MKVEIIEYATGKAVKVVGCPNKSEWQVDRMDDGININLDHDRFYTRVVKKEIEKEYEAKQ